MINSFWGQLKKFGIARIFMSLDFLVPVLIVLVIERLTLDYRTYDLDYGQILNVLVGLFSFVFAALAILIALSGTNFSKYLIKNNSYDSLLFHYWYTCNIFIISIGYTLLIDLANITNKYAGLAAVFLVAYSLCITLGLVKVTISAGLYKARFDTHK